jgi:hypothetical protein
MIRLLLKFTTDFDSWSLFLYFSLPLASTSVKLIFDFSLLTDLLLFEFETTLFVNYDNGLDVNF